VTVAAQIDHEGARQLPRLTAGTATSRWPEIRSPSPLLPVSRGRSLIGRGPDRSSHLHSAQRRPGDVCGPMQAHRKALARPASPGHKPGAARRGLCGLDRPPSADSAAPQR
jgi:hypothetical protein